MVHNKWGKTDGKKLIQMHSMCNPNWSRIIERVVLTKWKLLNIPSCHIKHSHITASICYSWVRLELPIVIGVEDLVTEIDIPCRNAPGIAITNKDNMIFQVAYFLPSPLIDFELVDQKTYSLVPHLQRKTMCVTKNYKKIFR